MTDAAEAAALHLAVCERFGRAVRAAVGRWEAPSPCTDWCARDVLEHVIGFHDVLLLRPLGAKPERPRDDPVRRWSVTVEALGAALERPGLFETVVDVPAVGANPPTRLDARRLVPALSTDVLAHTWDLARAVGADDHLDPQWCERFLARLPASDDLVRTGMYGAAAPVPDDAGPQDRWLARLGRDPRWRQAG